jgi:hypothetical protein
MIVFEGGEIRRACLACAMRYPTAYWSFRFLPTGSALYSVKFDFSLSILEPVDRGYLATALSEESRPRIPFSARFWLHDPLLIAVVK